MLPTINEAQADFVLGLVKNGLDDLVSKTEFSDNNKIMKIDLQPNLIEKFSLKFPDAKLEDLDEVVNWIILKSASIKRDKSNG